MTGELWCPWCRMPSIEHEIVPGHLHWTWVCVNAPPGWRGVFYDRPVEPDSQHGRMT